MSLTLTAATAAFGQIFHLRACLGVGRVALLSSGSLKIHSPSKSDEGLYTCIARNQLGLKTASSWVKIIGKGEKGKKVT